jgi:hypothetical protein
MSPTRMLLGVWAVRLSFVSSTTATQKTYAISLYTAVEFSWWSEISLYPSSIAMRSAVLAMVEARWQFPDVSKRQPIPTVAWTTLTDGGPINNSGKRPTALDSSHSACEVSVGEAKRLIALIRYAKPIVVYTMTYKEKGKRVSKCLKQRKGFKNPSV